jgi:hypothetical protein
LPIDETRSAGQNSGFGYAPRRVAVREDRAGRRTVGGGIVEKTGNMNHNL